MTRLTDAAVAEIQARSDASTTGPWFVRFAQVGHVPTDVWNIQSNDAFIAEVATDPDAAFIATGHSDIPKLLAEVARLHQLNNLAEQTIHEAERALAAEVVPFGDSMWRHWDKKILATRKVLAEYNTARENTHE